MGGERERERVGENGRGLQGIRVFRLTGKNKLRASFYIDRR